MAIKAAVACVFKEDTEATRIKIEEVQTPAEEITDEEERRIQTLGQITPIKVDMDETDMAKVIIKAENMIREIKLAWAFEGAARPWRDLKLQQIQQAGD